MHIRKVILTLLLAVAAVFCFAVSVSAGEIAYGAATVDTTSLNIRSGPSTDYDVVDVVADGTRMVVLDTDNEQWYHVNYQGTLGYVDSTYLREIVTAENFYATGKLTATDVNMRARPSTQADILDTYDIDLEVQVIGINSGWYKITYNGETGYIRSDLMTIVGPPESITVATATTVVPDSSSSSPLGHEIANTALKYLGYSYVYGSASPETGFDCSGLVYYVYGLFGYTLDRTADEQYTNNGTLVYKSELKQGDLVFFSSNGGYSVTHVGIYIGNNQFVHASTSKTGVIISDLTSEYYSSVYYGAKRIA